MGGSTGNVGLGHCFNMDIGCRALGERWNGLEIRTGAYVIVVLFAASWENGAADGEHGQPVEQSDEAIQEFGGVQHESRRTGGHHLLVAWRRMGRASVYVFGEFRLEVCGGGLGICREGAECSTDAGQADEAVALTGEQALPPATLLLRSHDACTQRYAAAPAPGQQWQGPAHPRRARCMLRDAAVGSVRLTSHL